MAETNEYTIIDMKAADGEAGSLILRTAVHTIDQETRELCACFWAHYQKKAVVVKMEIVGPPSDFLVRARYEAQEEIMRRAAELASE